MFFPKTFLRKQPRTGLGLVPPLYIPGIDLQQLAHVPLRAFPTLQPSPRLGGKKKWCSSGAAQARGGCGTHLLGLARRQVLPEVQNEGVTVALQYHYSTATVPR
ncbi:unnamed protein product [Prunus armeniaca]